MSTKSFIINLPIITGDQDRRRLRKSFSFGCNLQNAVMGGGWDRVLTYAPERICEAVLAGVTAWLDAGVVVIQAREGITEREFGRFRRRGIPSSTVQGLRQRGFRGRSDSKSGTTPRRKASTVSKPSHFSGEVV